MDIMVTLGELWHTKPSVLWSLLTPSVVEYRMNILTSRFNKYEH